MASRLLLFASCAAIAVFACSFEASPALAFDCAEKYCSAMGSCAEAYYHLEVCGEGERDADNDTIPCENVCGKTLEEYRRRRGPSLPTAPLQQFAPAAKPGVPANPKADEATTSAFRCAGKRKCGEMASCEEARFYLSTCGVSSLDRDHDGAPCESLCGGR